MKRLVTLGIVISWCAPAFARERDFTVLITVDDGSTLVATPQWIVRTYETGVSDKGTFQNLTTPGETIYLNCILSPPGVPDPDGDGRSLAYMNSASYWFTCDEHEGTWRFYVKQDIDGDGDIGDNEEVTVTVIIVCGTPTVSEWGMVVLVLLLLTAVTIVVGRRRRAAIG